MAFMYLVFTHIPDKSFFDVSLVEFVYLVFTRMPGESYCRRLRSVLLRLCDVVQALTTPLGV